MQKGKPKRAIVKEQSQKSPGLESEMEPHPVYANFTPGSGKLQNKKCIITGGDSGIGRAVAIAFAKEGADVALIYLEEEEKDAEYTAAVIRREHDRKCVLIQADLAIAKECRKAVEKALKKLGGIDVVVNNAGVQFPEKKLEDIREENLIETFAVNIFAMFWIVKAALPHLKKGSAIINTASVTAYRGSPGLLDYSATKGAIVSFTRSLSANLIDDGIRVNAVAPGPVWTPLIVSTMDPKEVAKFGTDSPMGRPGQPAELAPAYVFLASGDASYISGQVIHVNGGEIVNG